VKVMKLLSDTHVALYHSSLNLYTDIVGTGLSPKKKFTNFIMMKFNHILSFFAVQGWSDPPFVRWMFVHSSDIGRQPATHNVCYFSMKMSTNHQEIMLSTWEREVNQRCKYYTNKAVKLIHDIKGKGKLMRIQDLGTQHIIFYIHENC